MSARAPISCAELVSSVRFHTVGVRTMFVLVLLPRHRRSFFAATNQQRRVNKDMCTTKFVNRILKK